MEIMECSKFKLCFATGTLIIFLLIVRVQGKVDDFCKQDGFDGDLQIVSSKNLALKQPLVCKEDKTPISLRIRQREGKHHRSKVVIRRCPSVANIVIHFPENGGTIYSSTSSSGKIRSCSGVNNTFILPRNRLEHRDKTVLSFQLGSLAPSFLILSYDLMNHGTVNTFSFRVDLDQHSFIHRNKREAATETKVNRSLLPRGCGHEKSCIRFGPRGCAHMECSYFVSYQRLRSTDLEIEISAQTSGWVAIGFSSDNRMGGDDDVLVCKRKGQYSADIVAESMLNRAPYTPPQPKNSVFNLTAAKYKDGFIYCKITRPLKVNLEGNLDLYNDWYQLYAKGPITSTGVMLQHENVPATSKNTIAVVNPVNYQNSVAPIIANSIIVVMVTMIVSFFVS